MKTTVRRTEKARTAVKGAQVVRATLDSRWVENPMAVGTMVDESVIGLVQRKSHTAAVTVSDVEVRMQ